ncbi:MAG: hypothetical protein K0S41_1071 [Anaerocolumna sp.]|jgi:hypothetical protein|nr:hypothetical protein [Anaerocolumna sp.]
MNTKNFDDYKIADISAEDINVISELEKTISSNANQDIILIAYQPAEGTVAK